MVVRVALNDRQHQHQHHDRRRTRGHDWSTVMSPNTSTSTTREVRKRRRSLYHTGTALLVILFFMVIIVYLRVETKFLSSYQSSSDTSWSGTIRNTLSLSSPSSPCEHILGSDLIKTGADRTDMSRPYPFLPIEQMFPTLEAVKKKMNDDVHIACHYECPMHHPHFMQELMRCFSLWQSRPSDEEPVLLVPRQQFARYFTNPEANFLRWPFDHGILETLKQKIGLKVVKTYPNITGVRTHNFMEKDLVMSSYAMRSRDDAIALRRLFVESDETDPDTDDEDHQDHRLEGKKLNIAIVNRAIGRSILNPEEVLHLSKTAFPQHNLSLYYLENYTFPEIVDFYSHQDIVVTAHGSQVTGIMFMRPCSGVLELWPDLFYSDMQSNYFASLAEVSGLVHSNWYVSNNPIEEFLPLDVRLNNTANKMCPEPDRVVEGIKSLILRRQECRRRTPSMAITSE